MAVRSLDLADLIIQSANARGLEAAATVEKPKPQEDPDSPGSTLSGVELPEARARCEKHAAVASSNGCVYGLPYWKHSTWRGELRDLATVPDDCRCGTPKSRRLTIRGKTRSRDSAKYPLSLCKTHARLVVDAWERNLPLEWAAWEATRMRSSSLPPPAGAAKGLRPSALPLAVASSTYASRTAASPPQISKKTQREQENRSYVGGMRNPTHAVSKIRGLLGLGPRVVDTFESFVKENPETLDIGKNFGAKNYKGPSTELVRNYRDTLRRDLGAPAELKPGREFSRARCARASCHAPATRVCEVCGNWYCEGCTIVEPVDPRRCLCLQCFSDEISVVQQTDFAPGPEATDGETAIVGRAWGAASSDGVASDCNAATMPRSRAAGGRPCHPRQHRQLGRRGESRGLPSPSEQGRPRRSRPPGLSVLGPAQAPRVPGMRRTGLYPRMQRVPRPLLLGLHQLARHLLHVRRRVPRRVPGDGSAVGASSTGTWPRGFSARVP